MAWSRDPRTPTRWMRGSKRYNDVGGHSPPGDELENTRDHERIWFELRRHRNCCCDENNPGFRYCLGPRADYPTMICAEQFLTGATLLDYWSGGGNNDGVANSWFLTNSCGGNAKMYSEPFGSATFYPDGSWRNGPFVTGMSKPGLTQNITPWWKGYDWVNSAHSFEFWIKPSPTDIAQAKQLTSAGPFMGLSSGGYFTYLTASGAVSFAHRDVAGGVAQVSAAGVFTADEWHHVVFVRRTTNGGSFSIYVNGKRVLYTPFVYPVADVDDTSAQFAWATGATNSHWADLARYSGAISGSSIWRHYRSMAEDYGLPLPDGSDPNDGGDSGGGGGGVPDPGDFVFDLSPDRIDGEDKLGYVMMSDGDSGFWQSPEDSPFELEERKGVASGYASLDADVQVPSAQLGRARVVTDPVPEYVLTKDDADERIWTPGQPVPKPASLGQMLRADPSTSEEWVALLDSIFGSGTYDRWPLTEASLPYANGEGGGFGSLGVWGTGPTPTLEDDVCFYGERVAVFDGTDGLQSSVGPSVNSARQQFFFWIKLASLPASTVNVVKWGSLGGLRLRSDGLLELWSAASVRVTSATPLEVGRWTFVGAADDGAGATLTSKIWIDGAVDGSGSGNWNGGFATCLVAGDGLQASIAHLVTTGYELSQKPSDAQVASLYQSRRPVWTLVSDVAGGIEASENDVDITAAARGRVNFKAGANVTVDVVDDAAGDEVEVTIAATAPAGSGIEVSANDVDVSASPRGRINVKDGFGTTVAGVDDGVNDEVEITVDLPDATGKADGDVLALDATLTPVWETPASGLPDTTGKSDGDVLALDATLTPVWETPAAGGGGGVPVKSALLSDVKASGTSGGSGSAATWNTRTLNTEVDPDGIVTLSGNQFSLSDGTYIIRASGQAYLAGRVRLRIYNVSDSAVAILGANGYTNASGTVDFGANVPLEGTLVVSGGPKTFRLDQYTEVAVGGVNLLGVATSTGASEVYAYVAIEKIDGGSGGDVYITEPAAQPPATAHAMDDEFDGASLDAKWTWHNKGSYISESLQDGALILDRGAGAAGGSIATLVQSASFAGDFTLTARLEQYGSYSGLSVGVASGNQIIFAFLNGKALIYRLTSAGAWVSNILAATAYPARYLRIKYVSGVLRFLLSNDGRVFWEISTTYRQTVGGGQHLTSIGEVGLSAGQNAAGADSIEFFRVTEP